MNIQMHLSAKAIMVESETALVTQRLVRQEWFVMMSALLGSIFGLMGTFATGLGYFEGLVNIYENRIEKRRNLQDIDRNSEMLKAEFGRFRIKTLNGKIAPIFTQEESYNN